MAEDTGALTPSEEAFFESGGQADPESGETSGEESESSEVVKSESVPVTSEPEAKAKPVEEEKRPEKTVPIAALHQARMEIKEIKERNAKMEQMFQKIMERQQVEDAPQIPALDADPLTHFAMKNQYLEQQIAQLQQSQQGFEQQQMQREQMSNFNNHVNRLEAEFAKANPDYMDATVHLKTQIVQDALDRGVSEEEAIHAMNQQMQVMVTQAANVGMNPAQLAYSMAQSRGWKAKAPTPAPTPTPTPAEKIESINKGQAAAKSLSSTGGKGKPELTLEAMAEMDPEELEKNWNQIRKLM